MAEPINGRRSQCFKNAEETEEYIGEHPCSIGRLVLEENLPAWKRNGTKIRRAIDIDLDDWMLEQRKKFIPSRFRDAGDEVE